MSARVKWFLFLMVVMITLPLKVSAQCDYQRLADLSKIASNVKISYNYELIGDDMVYHVELSNLTDDIYVVDSSNTIFNKNSFVKDYYDDAYVVFDIYSNDLNCQNEKILSKNLRLPYFNKYSLFDVCKKHLSHPLCQTWSVTSSYNEKQLIEELESVPSSSGKDVSISKQSDNHYFLISNIIFVFAIIFVGALLFNYFKKSRNGR